MNEGYVREFRDVPELRVPPNLISVYFLKSATFAVCNIWSPEVTDSLALTASDELFSKQGLLITTTV